MKTSGFETAASAARRQVAAVDTAIDSQWHRPRSFYSDPEVHQGRPVETAYGWADSIIASILFATLVCLFSPEAWSVVRTAVLACQAWFA